MRTGLMRLLSLREQTEAVGETMALQRGRFAALADPSSAPRVVSSFNLFQTPEPLAARMAEVLTRSLPVGGTVLEPSAGLGRLYRAMRDAGHDGPMILADISPDCCRELYGMTNEGGATIRQGDFLTMDLPMVDGVIMNPPFKQGMDIKHIRRAYGKLKPSGRLVALCANGPRQRAALMPLVESWEDLPPGSFKETGTNVNAALLVLKAPK